MKYGTAPGALVLSLLVAVFLGGCWPGLVGSAERLEVMRIEIDALVADRSSTSDSGCGIVAVGVKACGGPEEYLVYSRGTVDEAVLLEKVRQYNELEDHLNRQYQLLSTCDTVPVPSGAISQNGVCVAGSR